MDDDYGYELGNALEMAQDELQEFREKHEAMKKVVRLLLDFRVDGVKKMSEHYPTIFGMDWEYIIENPVEFINKSCGE